MILLYYVVQYHLQWTFIIGNKHTFSCNHTVYFGFLYVTDLNECWGCVQTFWSGTLRSTTALCPFLFNESQVSPLIPYVAVLAWNILWLCRTLQMCEITLTSQHLNIIHGSCCPYPGPVIKLWWCKIRRSFEKFWTLSGAFKFTCKVTGNFVIWKLNFSLFFGNPVTRYAVADISHW